jgi:hypothetical protein
LISGTSLPTTLLLLDYETSHSDLIVYLPSHVVVSQSWLDKLLNVTTYLGGCHLKSFVVAGEWLVPICHGRRKLQMGEALTDCNTLNLERKFSRF